MTNKLREGTYWYTVHWRVVDASLSLNSKWNITRVRGETTTDALEKIRHKLDIQYPDSHIDISIVARSERG